jgi:Cu/Ag efflux protein CusF
MGGTVVAVDAAAKKITIKQDSVKKQKKVTLSVGKKAAKDLAGINAGDAVDIWVTGNSVTGISKVF